MTIRDNTNKINELIEIIDSLPIAGSGSSGSSGSVSSSPTIIVSEVNNGHNITIINNDEIQSFFVPNGTPCTHSWNGTVLSITSGSGTTSSDLRGPKGEDGSDGVGVSSISQTTTSSVDGGTNVITAVLTDGTTQTFNIKNGSKGSDGSDGTNATINGVNTLTIDTSSGITKSQNGSTMTIGANLTNILASGKIILKEGTQYHYGDTLPTSGTKGRLFFLKKT